MPRIARVVLADVPHHVTHRGNRRGDVFWTDEDRRKYLVLLQEYAAKYALWSSAAAIAGGAAMGLFRAGWRSAAWSRTGRRGLPSQTTRA